MKDKTNILLTIGIIALFLIFSGELYFLFFYQKKEAPIQISNKQSTTAKPSADLWLKQTDKATGDLFKEIHRKVDFVKPLYQSGVLKELVTTETYKSVVESIGNQTEYEKNPQGTVIEYNFSLTLSTFADKGPKTFRYTLTKEEMALISVFKSQGDEEIPVDLSEIQKGDLVSISITYDNLMSSQNNLISLKIVKLL